MEENLFNASLYGNLETVKILLEQGADVDLQSNDGNTALIYASRDGNLETVKFLLEQGADINLQSNDGWTALIMALRFGNLGIMKFLLEQGANVNLQDDKGKIFFDYLEPGDKKEIEEFLEQLSGVYIKGDPL